MALQLGEAEQQQQQNLSLSINNNGGDEGVGGGNKAPRLPRWTRQEILVLIQGKRVAEGRVRRGRAAGLASGTASVEPKWATVSSYCKRHGVNRGPVQCRKRWSNLAGDFKKIKEWESQIKDESDSFWVMRSDLRRERKLPGFFDKEVYDILDGAGGHKDKGADDKEEAEEEEAEAEPDADAEVEPDADAEAEAVFDSGRSAAADDGLFSDFEQSDMDRDTRTQGQSQGPPIAIPMAIPAPTPISEKQYQPFTVTGVVRADPGNHEKQPAVNPETGSTSQEGRKRRRFVAEDDAVEASLQDHLIQVLERNGRILTAQLEAQNINLKLDREERKDHASSLVAVLNKLADALGRIADKL